MQAGWKHAKFRYLVIPIRLHSYNFVAFVASSLLPGYPLAGAIFESKLVSDLPTDNQQRYLGMPDDIFRDRTHEHFPDI